MGIEDIQISEELKTNAPSIKYRGNEGPKSPQEMEQMMIASLEEEYAKYKFDMLEQGLEPMSLQKFIEQAMAEAQMSGGQPLPQDPTKPVNPFQPKPQGPVLPDRQMAAYGGIMGLDGRKQYGAGSWFQENVMDNYKKYVLGQSDEQIKQDSQDRVDAEDLAFGKNYENPIDTFLKGKREDPDDPDSKRTGGQAQNIIPAVGGILAGLFTKNSENDTPGLPSDVTALAIDDLKKSANILDQKQGMAAGLNFLPAVAARKYTPQEMVEVYQNAANGGRIGFSEGTDSMTFGVLSNNADISEEINQKVIDYENEYMNRTGNVPPEFYGEKYRMQLMQEYMNQNKANGGRIGFSEGTNLRNKMSVLMNKMANGTITPEEMIELRNMESASMFSTAKGMAEGGIMDLGGMEKDYRAEGGFVPIGREEKADDVPARLSVNEFVFTADAVRNAGGGDIDQGAQVMENMMKHLEAGGQVSEESQGMAGARDMFEVSERLSEVV